MTRPAGGVSAVPVGFRNERCESITLVKARSGPISDRVREIKTARQERQIDQAKSPTHHGKWRGVRLPEMQHDRGA